MKLNRFFWILMVALLVPAMALSGCDKKKNSNNDKDDDGSSSGSKESTEKVEKENEKEEKSAEISGRYEVDLEALDIDSKDIDDINAECYFDFDDNDELNIELEAEFVKSIPEINNSMELSFKMKLDGDWEYNKKDKSLLIDMKDVEIYDFDVDFEDDNELTRAMIDQMGGYEALEQQFRRSMVMNVNKKSTKYIVTDIDEDGFTAKKTKGKKETLRFKKVD